MTEEKKIDDIGITPEEFKEKFPTTIPNISPNLKGIVSSEEMKEAFKKANDSLGIENIVSENGEKDWTKESIPPFLKMDKDIKAIVDQTKEIISQNPFEKLMEKLRVMLDFTGDNKIDFEDLKEFVKLFFGVLIVIYFTIFTIKQDEILLMLTTGTWDWSFFYDNILYVGLSAIGAFFFNLFKKRWLETDTLAMNYKSKTESAYKTLAEIQFQHDLEIEKINHSHALELINKEIQIKTKDELARIEILKADIIDEIKKLLPGSKIEN